METTELATKNLSTEQIASIMLHVAMGKSISSWFTENNLGDKERMEFMRSINPDPLRPNMHNKALAKWFDYARNCQADSCADKIFGVIEDVKAGRLEPHAGRVAIDGYKWVAARLKPVTWGDKQTVDVNHKVGNVSLMDYLLEHATLKPVDKLEEPIEAEYTEDNHKALEG